MKLIATTVTTLALAVLASASFAADATNTRPARPSDGKGKPEKPPIADVVAHLSKTYSQVAPFDLNVNGQLEQSERKLLVDAITAGTLKLTPPALPPGRTPPEGVTPSPARIAANAVGMYVSVAVYDANVDGVLSADEQAALKAAIESGKLPRPAHKPMDGKGDQRG